MNKIKLIYLLYCIISKPTNTHKHLFSVKPRIDRTNLKAVAVRAGKSIFFDVNVRGEPAPKVQWFQKWKKDEKEVIISYKYKYIYLYINK